MRLYCAKGHSLKTRSFQPEPDELSCPECGGRMGSFKPREKGLEGRKSARKSHPISPASPAQRAKVRDLPCLVCGRDRYEAAIHPAHLASRPQGGGDDPLDVVPLCAEHHRLFDDGRLSILEHLEPRYRDEVAQAVRHMGLIGALHRLTGDRYVPVKEAA